MKLAHFYHCYADGAWEKPVSEHLDALDESGFDGPFHVGLVGAYDHRREALAFIRERRPVAGRLEQPRGYEQVTINALRDYAKRNDGAIMYAHTKGAAHRWHTGRSTALSATATAADGTTPQDCWRRHMTARVVLGWRDCIAVLERGYDATGALWTSPENCVELEEGDRADLVHFSGTFWIARCEYLRTLGRCRADDRTYAELWIGNRGRGCRAHEAPPHDLRLEPWPGEPYYKVHGFACVTCRAGLGDPHYPPIVADLDGNVCCYAKARAAAGSPLPRLSRPRHCAVERAIGGHVHRLVKAAVGGGRR